MNQLNELFFKEHQLSITGVSTPMATKIVILIIWVGLDSVILFR